jgi:uracil-DNA glycosylase
LRPLLVGQAPGRLGGARAFAGDKRSARRLAELVGARRASDFFRTRNLLQAFPGKAGKGDRFPMAEARAAATKMRLRGTVLFAGKKVAAAFGCSSAMYFEWRRRGGFRYAVVPHPSGVNRWWNDPSNRERARAFFRDLAVWFGAEATEHAEGVGGAEAGARGEEV